MSGKNKTEDKVVSTKSVSKALTADENGMVEITLVKDHGRNKKGEKLLKHFNTGQMLIDKKIAK